jgi:putative endonuclease
MFRVLRKTISNLFGPKSFDNFGQQAEDRAARFLKSLGHKVLARNVASSFGEMDIVSLDGNTLVFVEVKARKSKEYGEPWESVTKEKQARLSRMGHWYLTKHPHEGIVRFDVISIYWPNELGNHPEIEHFKNAFDSQI